MTDNDQLSIAALAFRAMLNNGPPDPEELFQHMPESDEGKDMFRDLTLFEVLRTVRLNRDDVKQLKGGHRIHRAAIGLLAVGGGGVLLFLLLLHPDTWEWLQIGGGVVGSLTTLCGFATFLWTIARR